MRTKEILSFFFILIILTGCSQGRGEKVTVKSGSQANVEIADISFREFEYDFGKIKEGEKVAHIFSYENKGPGNLVIESASSSCGCTVSKYSRSPIPAGKGGNLEVVFDSNGRNGIQTKTVSVRSNSKTEVVILKITAEVISQDK
jgi:Protein of unknown function (DUF1573)